MGYFPTYTLGNLNAAQLMARARQDHPSLQSEIERGEYGTLLSWLRDKIHKQGQRLLPQDLIQQATGEKTRSSYHLNYLRQKFTGK